MLNSGITRVKPFLYFLFPSRKSPLQPYYKDSFLYPSMHHARIPPVGALIPIRGDSFRFPVRHIPDARLMQAKISVFFSVDFSSYAQGRLPFRSSLPERNAGTGNNGSSSSKGSTSLPLRYFILQISSSVSSL